MRSNLYLRFTGGLKRALTLSYDDGVIEDVRLVEILRQHGLKGTFNMNSGRYSPEGTTGDDGKHRRMTLSEAQAIHASGDMEIASHSVSHPSLDTLPGPLAIREILNDRENLERDFGRMVRGFAYPYGPHTEETVEIVKASGLVYARKTKSTHGFELPDNWFEWQPTCHHNDPELFNLVTSFFEDRYRPKLFYVWGHSYEFADYGNWDRIERFAELTGNRDDVWYATNVEIYDYVTAFRRLVFSADSMKVFNPSAMTVWIETLEGGMFELPGGKTTEIRF